MTEEMQSCLKISIVHKNSKLLELLMHIFPSSVSIFWSQFKFNSRQNSSTMQAIVVALIHLVFLLSSGSYNFFVHITTSSNSFVYSLIWRCPPSNPPLSHEVPYGKGSIGSIWYLMNSEEFFWHLNIAHHLISTRHRSQNLKKNRGGGRKHHYLPNYCFWAFTGWKKSSRDNRGVKTLPLHVEHHLILSNMMFLFWRKLPRAQSQE